MTLAALIHSPGPPEAIRLEEVDLPAPGEREVRVAQHAIGVNFIDVYLRSGLYPAPQSPLVLGVEGSGIVEAVGPRVTKVKVGDRVAYAGPPVGSYCAARVIHEDRLMRLPDAVSFETAAGGLLRGLTAHMLLCSLRLTQAGDWLLVHAGAGGLGQLMTRWAVRLGARVIATVGTPGKAAIARQAGAREVLSHRDPEMARKVREITGGAGVAAAYDGIGGETFARTLECVAPFGLVASVGQAGGPVPDLPLEALGPRRSLVLARPSVMLYAAATQRYRPAAEEVLGLFADGLPVDIGAERPLEEAAAMHRDLETGGTIGSLILRP